MCFWRDLKKSFLLHSTLASKLYSVSNHLVGWYLKFCQYTFRNNTELILLKCIFKREWHFFLYRLGSVIWNDVHCSQSTHRYINLYWGKDCWECMNVGLRHDRQIHHHLRSKLSQLLEIVTAKLEGSISMLYLWCKTYLLGYLLQRELKSWN